MRKATTTLMILVAAMALSTAGAQEPPSVKQDPELLRFASRVLPFYPNSTFTIQAERQFRTASGSYRIVEVKRACASPHLSGISTLVVDEPARRVWIGSVGELPLAGSNASATAVREFVSDFLPQAMERNMRIRSRGGLGGGSSRRHHPRAVRSGDPVGLLAPIAELEPCRSPAVTS
jgi:hypothetical protein